MILISHNMPHVFEVADRIHIQRLGRRARSITPKSHTMTEAVAIMTGAAEPPPAGRLSRVAVNPATPHIDDVHALLIFQDEVSDHASIERPEAHSAVGIGGVDRRTIPGHEL